MQGDISFALILLNITMESGEAVNIQLIPGWLGKIWPEDL